MDVIDLGQLTKNNKYFRHVIATYPSHQIVLMSVDDQIPCEIHDVSDQFIRVEKGAISVVSGNREYLVTEDQSISIPRNTYHQVFNVDPRGPSKIYTIYSPPHHEHGHIDVYSPATSDSI